MIGGFYVAVRSTMEDEIKAAIERDPAALSVPEVVLTYSGVHALFFFRVSSVLHRRKVRFLPRFISQFSRWLTGIEIHPGASIGKGLFIDHGMGVVIGETTIIGNNVTLFQGVTLGGTGKETGKRHPTIGDNVVVGAGAKVLGDISVGGGVNIGANAVVIRSVPEDSTVVGVPGRVARKKGRKIPGGINLDHTSLPDPLQQSIEKLQHEIDHIESEIEEYHVQKKKMTAKDADGEGSDI
jgi:serine O-acetyltransferase